MNNRFVLGGRVYDYAALGYQASELAQAQASSGYSPEQVASIRQTIAMIVKKANNVVGAEMNISQPLLQQAKAFMAQGSAGYAENKIKEAYPGLVEAGGTLANAWWLFGDIMQRVFRDMTNIQTYFPDYLTQQDNADIQSVKGIATSGIAMADANAQAPSDANAKYAVAIIGQQRETNLSGDIDALKTIVEQYRIAPPPAAPTPTATEKAAPIAVGVVVGGGVLALVLHAAGII